MNACRQLGQDRQLPQRAQRPGHRAQAGQQAGRRSDVGIMSRRSTPVDGPLCCDRVVGVGISLRCRSHAAADVAAADGRLAPVTAADPDLQSWALLRPTRYSSARSCLAGLFIQDVHGQGEEWRRRSEPGGETGAPMPMFLLPTR